MEYQINSTRNWQGQGRFRSALPSAIQILVHESLMLLIPYYTHSHTMSSTTAPAVLLSLHLLLLLFCYPAPAVLLSLHLLLLLFCYPYIYCSCCSNIPTSMHCSCCSVFPYIYCSCHSVIPTSTAPAVLLSLRLLLLLFCIPTSTAPSPKHLHVLHTFCGPH